MAIKDNTNAVRRDRFISILPEKKIAVPQVRRGNPRSG
jgi:hypothetical protein